jgi:radical SAM superfamily enzyme YgiQ (UPF0313 family)
MPLALVALASALDRSRFDVVIIDGRLESDPVARVVEATRGALCLGLTVLTGAPIHDALAVSRAVKAAHPGCTVVWGGWHPSLFARECLREPGVDVAVAGQGEDTFVDIASRLDSGESIAGCRGTLVKDGAVVIAGPTRPLRDLNELPRHDYSLIPVEKYFAHKGRRQVDYISSQGCRFRCAFCADPAVYRRAWTGLAPERVADEPLTVASLRDGELAFRDETFSLTARIGRPLTSFSRVAAWHGPPLRHQACRMGEVLAKAVRSGLRRVMVGVEAGSQETLDRLAKDVNVEQVIKTAELCARHDVGAIFNFIVGFPGESDASVDATLALAKRLRGMHTRFETPIFYYRPYPGNPLADAAHTSGYVFPEDLDGWADFDYVGARGPWITPSRWRRVERFKFYTRHAWKPGAWRWPLRATSQWRCNHDWYSLPVEKLIVDFVRPPQQVS